MFLSRPSSDTNRPSCEAFNWCKNGQKWDILMAHWPPTNLAGVNWYLPTCRLWIPEPLLDAYTDSKSGDDQVSLYQCGWSLGWVPPYGTRTSVIKKKRNLANFATCCSLGYLQAIDTHPSNIPDCIWHHLIWNDFPQIFSCIVLSFTVVQIVRRVYWSGMGRQMSVYSSQGL